MTSRKERTGRRKSDPGTLGYRPSHEKTIVAAELPWGVPKVVPATTLDVSLPTGLFAGQSVLIDVFNLFERKLQVHGEDEPVEKLLNKSLQRGGDPYFDNLCRTLSGVCELCLPAVLKELLTWHERMELSINEKINPANDNRFMLTKKLLAVNYLFCLVLIEILPQLEFHLTASEQSIKQLLDLAFKQVQYRDPTTMGVNNTNSLVVAETYAEVIGVLSQTRFTIIHKQFINLLNELKKEVSPTVSHQIIALLMAMKFVKIKTNQVDDFEVGIRFLDDLGGYFLEVKDKDVKHAVAGLLVEILLPVAAQIKREANIPALITFVGRLYGPTNDLASKKQHKLAAYPLLTCLLCVSQRQFFLTNWVPFLNNTLANLKNRDSRISRVALESLYRLLWVYIIRNNLDGNTSTRTRLESICGSLFPKGNRNIVPRDAPLNIFVKIIHFIAQQKLDFAFKDVIFDLLACNRSSRTLCPERMNIGIRALMVIADGLQQKEEPPAMPKSMGPLASGTIQRLKKKTYITRPLTVDIARTIGLDQYYTPCRKAFDSILRTLDTQVGKPLMMTAIQGRKEPEELLGGDVKPKLDLYRTCVAAIPRLLPQPMTHVELIEMLSRLTVHVDEELRVMSGSTLQTMLAEFPEWRDSLIIAFVQLISTQLTDFFPTILDDSLRLLLQMIVTWKSSVMQEKRKDLDKPLYVSNAGSEEIPPPLYLLNYSSVLHSVEGLAIVMLCQIRSQPRKLAISLLKEVKQLMIILNIENCDSPVITVLDEATPYVVRKYIEHVPLFERMSWPMDFATVCEKIGSIESDNGLVNQDRGNEYLQWDPWACALSGYTESKYLLSRCPLAVASAWPVLYNRLNGVSGFVDPNNPQNESRASLLRSSKSKASSAIGETLSHDGCLSLWQKYVLLCCSLAPSPHNPASVTRSFSPTSSLADSDILRSVSSSLRSSRAPATASNLQQLFVKATAMLRWENMTDIRDNVVLGVGSMNPHAFEAFLEELNQRGVLREAQDKKIETNARRRKRKDLLRLQVLRIIEVAVWRGVLDVALIDTGGSLSSLLVEFIDSMRINLETDQDRDMGVVTLLRLHLAKVVAMVVDAVAPDARAHLLPDDRKQHLFYLFIGWCSKTIASDKKLREKEVGSYVEQKAAVAMTRLLCCGPIFEPHKSISEDGYLYGWLDKLIASSNTTMQDEVEEMLAWMLELNESSHLLDWLLAQCYSQVPSVSARCFRALVRVFSRRDFPCDFISLFVLCQTMAGDSEVADAAVCMVEVLRKQFLDSNAVMCSPLGLSSSSPVVAVRGERTEDIGLVNGGRHCFPLDQRTLCNRLANQYPHLTITIFSEVSFRLESARNQNQTHLLAMLVPWVENLELIDPVAGEDACEGPRGWGSEEATQLLLNNLMYLTATLAVEHECEIAELWRALAVSFPANLPVILNYLYVTTVLSHEALLPYAKRVSVLVSTVVGTRLATLLLEQLTTSSDGGRMVLERSEIPPFYRWKDESPERKDTTVERVTPAREEERPDDTKQDGVRLLPMPAYGGHYSALSSRLPHTSQPIQFFTRSQVALLLVCDTVRASAEVDWTEATPRLLHSAVLNLDSLRPALCRHARQTIINVCLLYADSTTLAHVAGILLNNQMDTMPREWRRQVAVRGESPTFARVAAEEYRQALLNSNALFSSSADLIVAIVFCLSENIDQPLWANEDATPRSWRVPSSVQLSCLVRHLAELLLPSMPLLPVVWTQMAMRMALTIPQRHAAGRCFQIVSSLCQPPSAWVPSLISRLVETAGETHEDTQAYVTDLLLCLINNVPHLSPLSEPPQTMSTASPTHARSTSYTPALLRQSVLSQRYHERKAVKSAHYARLSLLVAEEEPWAGTAMIRSKSADQLKTDAEGDEEATARMQICAIAVALLDSGLENEFLLAVNLLDKILDTASVHKLQCVLKLEKTIAQLDWKGFSGIVGLVARGAVVGGAYEASVQAMVRLVDVVEESVVGGKASLGVAIIHCLPLMTSQFEAPTPVCSAMAQAVIQYCEVVAERDKLLADNSLNLLATMMTQYSSRTFTKDRFQWAKCVIQYLCDSLDHAAISPMLVLLAEMLERGVASMHVYVLHLVYLLVLQRDPNDPTIQVNAHVVRGVSRHVQGANWREASRVYKAVVEQWLNAARDKGDVSVEFELDMRSVTSRASPPSPRKNLDAATLKRQPPSHVRVRDRLVGLLSASGLRVGLPSAQSVVFSPSELGSEASSTERICASSQEVASSCSLPEASASITDSFPRVFKEFDFLEAEHDSVSETAESCFGWLSTMRPRSIGDNASEHDEDVDYADDEYEELPGSSEESGDTTTTRLSRTSVGSSEDRTPCASDHDDIDDDGASADNEYDGVSSRLGRGGARDRGLSPITVSSRDGDMPVPRSVISRSSRERLQHLDEDDGSSFCCQSQVSMEYYPNHQNPSVIVQCPHHLGSKIESQWISVVSELADDTEGDSLAFASLLVTQLFRSYCGRVVGLLRDALCLFTTRPLPRAFASAQDVLTRATDCPFLFVTAQYLRNYGLQQRMRCSLYELREHVETFNERKEQTIRSLNSIRSAYKLTSLGGSTSSLNSNSITDLAKLLSKMFFQLMQMNDSLRQMITLIQESAGATAYTLSPAVLDHQRELLQCIPDLPPQSNLSDSAQNRPEQSGDSLVLFVANKRYSQALQAVRQLRDSYGSEFGCCEQTDVDVLLLQFCRSHQALKAWALVGAGPETLSRQSQSMREANADLAAAVRRMAQDAGPRTSTVSSMNDSFSKLSYHHDM